MYGFNPTLGSDYWNSGSSSSGSSSSSGVDWKTDWNTIGDYSGLSGQPFSSSTSQDNTWQKAFSKAAGYLTGTGRDRYRQKGEQQPRTQFSAQSGGGGFNQIAPDISVFMPQQQQPFTVAGQQQGGGIGSTIGGAIGTVGGAFIGGPFGASVGGSVGSSIGGLFG